jgi:hypothetical protein
MGIAAAGAVIGAGAGIAGGILSSNSAKKAAEDAMEDQQRLAEADAAEREKYSQMIMGEADMAREQLRASEQAAMNVFGSLGQPGTYDAPSQYGGPLTSLTPAGLGGMYGGTGPLLGGSTISRSGAVTAADVAIKGRGEWKGTKEWALTDSISNPDALAASIKSSSGFRTVSKLVADAEQMMNKSGPLWNELNNSVIGSIYQSSAATNRQALEAASQMIARKGGAARRGMDWVNSMRAQDAVNRDRTNTLWQAKLGLEQWTRDNAMKVQSFAQAWTMNHAGIRDAHTNAIANLRTFWSQTWPVAAAKMNQQSTQDMQQASVAYRNAVNEANQMKIASIANGVSSIGSSLMGGIGGMGGGGASAGGLGGMTGIMG